MNTFAVSGTLITPPSWFPSYLPKFFRQTNGQTFLRPLPTDAKVIITENDILDTLLYLQMIIGFGREGAYDFGALKEFPTVATQLYYTYVKNVLPFRADVNGMVDFTNIPFDVDAIDPKLYTDLQNRYIEHEGVNFPWIVEMQKIGGGIDLASIPFPSDVVFAVPPVTYPKHLPPLFISAAEPGRHSAGFVTFKPGFRKYQPTVDDISSAMLYAQPYVSQSKTPYKLNFTRPETKEFAGQLDGAYWLAYRLALPYGNNFAGGFYLNFVVMSSIKKFVLGYSIMVEPPKIPQTNSTLVAIGAALEGIVKIVPFVGTALTFAEKISNQANETDYKPGLGLQVAQDIRAKAAEKQAALDSANAASKNKKIIIIFVIILAIIIAAFIIIKNKKR
jgi:hypothetical protein